MDSSLTPNPEDFELSLTPNPEHSERISRSMRVLSYEEAKEGVSRYIEEHKDSKLVFCWYDRGVGVVFSPADHHGIWAAQREGTLSKGLVPDHFVTFLEGLAKSKGLI